MLRPAVLLALLTLSARGDAQLSPRMRMVARGQLPPPGLSTVRVAGGADRLISLGVPAQRLTADVAAITPSADLLRYLEAALPNDALAIEEQHPMRTMLDRAAVMIGAPAARMSSGLSGRGVLVGIVDTGVDLRHADLRTLDGHTRVVALLDQSHPLPNAPGPPGLVDYGGTVSLRADIDAMLMAEAAGQMPAAPIAQIDDEGHGTHVASIATSNGLATGMGLPSGRYVGIAPDAELLVARVTSLQGAISDVGVLSALRFVLDRASELGRPLVVNLSLGTGAGPHDGSTNFEHAFDQLFPRDTPGRAIVVAAGNDGGRDLHAGGYALDGEVELPLLLKDGGDGAFEVDVWYRGQLEVSVETPDGHRTDFVTLGTHGDTSYDGQARVLIDNSGTASSSGTLQAGIVIGGAGDTRPASGTWRFHLRGRSIRYDAWLQDGSTATYAHFTDRLVADDRLAVPATALGAIAVGSLASRFDWTTIDGRMFVPNGADPTRTGGPSFFSAPGPTTDGRFAPDVSAPGEYVIAAMSRDATPDQPASVFRADVNDLTALVADDGVHGVLRGTSQATPIVTGAIAVLLEADPTLNSETIREILRVSAAPVEGTAGWSPRAGFGRIDLGAAIGFLRGVRGTTPDSRLSTVGVSRDLLPPSSEETTTVTVTPRDGTGKPLGGGRAVAIELSAGAPLGDVVDRGGRYERVFVAHAPRGAIGVVGVVVDGVALSAQPQVFFVPSRAEAGSALSPGGGCSMTPSATLPTLLLFCAVTLTLLRRRRS